MKSKQNLKFILPLEFYHIPTQNEQRKILYGKNSKKESRPINYDKTLLEKYFGAIVEVQYIVQNV